MSTANNHHTPVWDIDPFDEEYLLNPYEHYNILRELGPVAWVEKYGLWAIGRHEQVHAVFSNWQHFCSSRGVGLSDFKTEKPWRPHSIVLEVDPPEHTRTRAVLARAMSPKAVAGLRETFAHEADLLIDRLIEQGSFDAVTELGEVYPLKVFPDAVGLDDDRRENLLLYGNMVFNGLGPDNALRREAMSHASTVGPWIAQKCQRDSLALAEQGFGATIYAAADSGEITTEEASLLVRSLLSAGVDTTVNALGNAMHCFVQHPEQWQLLTEQPKLARQAFEEVLRYESPIHTFLRTTAVETEIDGVQLGEGRKVLAVLASANRDPRRWENPDKFDITRKATGHMALGTGIHACVGQAVARQEADAVLSAMARKIASIELAGEPQWRPGNTLRSLASLPVIVKAK